VPWVDIALAALLLIAAWRGWRVGVLGQVGAIVGRIAGFLAGVTYGPQIVRHVGSPLWRTPLTVAVVIVGTVLGATIGRELGRLLAKALPLSGLRALDKGLGATTSVVGAAIVLWLVASVLSVVTWGGVADRVHQSLVLRMLQRVLPAPPAAVGDVQSLLSGLHIPNVVALVASENFSSLAGLTGGAAPTQPSQNASVVTVIGRGGCATDSRGTGFYVGPTQIVTTAHLVAGYQSIAVDGVSAHVTFIDSQEDVAVLQVAARPHVPFTLATTSASATTPVTVIGDATPGGQVSRSGFIGATLTVPSRGIYSEGLFLRPVTLVATASTASSSGSPVLVHHQVVAMLIAPSSVNHNVAYAVALATLRHDLAASSPVTVSSGRCVN